MSENEKEPEVFRYTYSAGQQKEVERIRRQYEPREESGLERLARLDKKARRLGSVTAITLGILSTLVMGAGMSLVLVWEYWIPGLTAGILGILGICVSYPLFKRINKRQREKYAPEILRLSRELMGEE